MIRHFQIKGNIALAVTVAAKHILLAIFALHRGLFADFNIAFNTPNVFGKRGLHIK